MPLTPTANPTDQEFLDQLALVDGGIFEAIQEIIIRLEANLPAKTAAFNTALGLTGIAAVPEPKFVAIAPAVMTDVHVNSVLVGSATTTKAGGPGTFLNESQVVIYSVGEHLESNIQIGNCHRRAAIIRGIMYSFLTGCVDSAGTLLWRQFEPSGVSFLPEPYADYAGAACYYSLLQTPEAGAWADL